MSAENTLKQYALSYAAIGWSVFPIKPGSKRPAVTHGFKEATRDASQIEAWWSQNPAYNIGIATGASGLIVIDLDEDEAKGSHGIQTLQAWEAVRGALPITVKCRTPRGGEHRYYKAVSPVPCKTGLYPAIDIRADGGYVVAPPSVVNGRSYQWIDAPGIIPICEADSRVYTFLSPVPDGFGKTSIPYTVPESILEGQRTDSLMKMLGSLQAKGLSDEAIRAAIMAENESRCNPPLTEQELEMTVFPALSRFQKGTAPYVLDRDYSADIAEIVERLKELHPESNRRYGWHDAGNGNLFSDLGRGTICYAPERKKWFYYDGMRWKPDTGGAQTMNYCKIVADALMSYTTMISADEKLRLDYIKHVSKWQQFKYRETILKDAATVAPVKISDFDSNPYLLNCLNGTLDLRSGEFHEHDGADIITKLANVEYRPGSRCTRWEQFVSEVTCGDGELARYLQKALGYALTGDTRHECFFILYGATSRNGKGTLCETFMHLIGDYGRTASPDSIAQQKYTDARKPSEDIARLAGARFVNMSEPDKKMTLSAALVKTLTGNDTIAARFLGENSFEFKPQFKMFINTNHLPYVSDSTLFSSDRVKVIPFNRHFEAWERDTHLKQQLTATENLSGILNWCVEWWRLLDAEGFSVPGAVLGATQNYNESSDKLGQFIGEMLSHAPGEVVKADIVHKAYQDWCWSNGFKPEGFSEFKKSLASAGIIVERKRVPGAGRNSNKVWLMYDHLLQDSPQ